ncbi:11356_t:CDS:2, partial [Scutellospora calospora]
ENAATNSKLNLILCNEENIIEKIKEAQLKFENSLNEEIVIEDMSDEKFCSDCKTRKRSYIDSDIEDEAEHIILQEELENNYHKIERELNSEKWFIDLVEEKARNKLRQKTIGAGKTTLSSFMSKYFEKKGLKVFIPEEISLKIKEDLDLFYLIIDTYRKMIESIDSATDDYDIIIFDRTYLDTE